MESRSLGHKTEGMLIALVSSCVGTAF